MYTIGKLARQAGVSNDTIRFYERRGLLACSRRTGTGYQLFDEEAPQRLSFIKRAQLCGFSLEEVRELLRLREDCNSPELHEFVSRKQASIDHTIAALRSMSAYLGELCPGSRPGAQGSRS